MVYYKVDEHIELELVSSFYVNDIFMLVQNNKEYLAEYLDWVDETKSPEVILENTKKALRDYSEKTGIGYVIKVDGKIVGRISLWEVSTKTKTFEIGYWISQEYTKKGIMTECTKVVINTGFKWFGSEKIEINCVVDNIASNRIAQKLGFTHEGIKRNAIKLRGKVYNMNRYGLLKSEWKEF